MDSDKPSSVRRLPLMRNVADAEIVARDLKDPFYLVAFPIQFWLGELMARAAANTPNTKIHGTALSNL